MSLNGQIRNIRLIQNNQDDEHWILYKVFRGEMVWLKTEEDHLQIGDNVFFDQFDPERKVVKFAYTDDTIIGTGVYPTGRVVELNNTVLPHLVLILLMVDIYLLREQLFPETPKQKWYNTSKLQIFLVILGLVLFLSTVIIFCIGINQVWKF